jgi:hypothetical protein
MSHSETNGGCAGAEFSQVNSTYTQVATVCPRQESNLRPFA